jgi:Zn-dependent alcohol dehydrogenase
MQAGVLRTPRSARTIEEIEVVEPGRGELLVRLHTGGFCHSGPHMLLAERSGPTRPRHPFDPTEQ